MLWDFSFAPCHICLSFELVLYPVYKCSWQVCHGSNITHVLQSLIQRRFPIDLSINYLLGPLSLLRNTQRLPCHIYYGLSWSLIPQRKIPIYLIFLGSNARTTWFVVSYLDTDLGKNLEHFINHFRLITENGLCSVSLDENFP